MRRAQREGSPRRDFVTEDFVLLLMANAGVLHMPCREMPNIGLNLVLLVLAAVVAYVRWPALAM